MDAWFGCGPVPASVLRQVAKQAGVFIWHDGDDPIYVNQGMLGMYCQSGGERKIRLPEDCRLVSLYEPEELCTKDGEVTIAFQPKEYKLFLRQ